MGQLLFKKCFFDAIRAGTKRTTLRRWTGARLKPGSRAFTPGVGWLRIESVDLVDLKSLKQGDAIADGFTSLKAMRHTLDELYPDAADNRDGRAWFRVTFHVEPTDDAAPAKSPTKSPAKSLAKSLTKSPAPPAIKKRGPKQSPARARSSAKSRAKPPAKSVGSLSQSPRRATSSDLSDQRRQLADALRKFPR